MNEDYKKEEAGLTTAALAAAGEPTASKIEPRRKEVYAGGTCLIRRRTSLTPIFARRGEGISRSLGHHPGRLCG